jgi:hypothetical protein
MRTHLAVHLLTGVFAWPLAFLVPLSTFLLGVLVTLTFGLLLLPISLVYIVFVLGPLLGLSWLWLRAPLARLPIALVGVPLAALGNAYTALMPAMGETDSRMTKLLLTGLWPYSLPYWQWDTGRFGLGDSEAAELLPVIVRETKGNPHLRAYVVAHEQRRAAAIAAADEAPPTEEVLDLMSALKASVERARKERAEGLPPEAHS